MQWDVHVQCDGQFCLEAYASNVKCKYTSGFGDVIDCTEFI